MVGIKLYHVVAASENGVIGKDGEIPWDHPKDLKRFKEITMGHPVVMGRRTFESLPNPLPRRLNLVLSRKEDKLEGGSYEVDLGGDITSAGGARVALRGSIDSALSLLKEKNFNEVYVIGGEEVYEATMSFVDEVRLSLIHDTIEDGDSFYPIEKLDNDFFMSYIDVADDDLTFIDYIPNVQYEAGKKLKSKIG